MLRRKNLEFDHMKFQPEHADGVNVISRLEAQRVWVGSVGFGHSLLVPWKGDPQAWPPQAVADLQAHHFDPVLALGAELVVFGSGPRMQFIHPSLYRALIDRRVGFETMDTAAACRTFNVLASEGRAVVAALLVGG